MKKHIIVLIICTLQNPAMAQKKIHIEDFTTKNIFRVNSIEQVEWMNDGNFYTAVVENKICKYNTTTGEILEVIFDGTKSEPSLTIDEYIFSDNEKKILILTQTENIYRRSFKGKYYIYERENKLLYPLSSEMQSYATFSPSGEMVSFVRNNNLFFVNLITKKETAITTSGQWNSIINGSTDWVYEEEFYITKAFEWSPDGKKIAFYTFDETEVSEYTMQKWNNGALYPENYKFKYPKAGTKNSLVSITVFDVITNEKYLVDIGKETDIYIPRMKWTQSSNVLSIQKMNRLQNQLDILHADIQGKKTSLILTEVSNTYIDITFCDDLTYLKNGTQFIYSSEKSGFKQFYLYHINGTLLQQITTAKGDAETKIRIDENQKVPILYYTSAENSPQERDIFRIDIHGKNKTKLNTENGWNDASMSNDGKYYFHYYSNTETPLRITLFETKNNKKRKVLQENVELVAKKNEYNLSPKEFFTFTTSNGTTLNAYFLKPKDLDPNKKNPVLIFQYSGPGSQNVTNSWGGSSYLWHQYLVQNGYIVVVIDTRGTGGRGQEFKNITYKQLGKLESEDLIETAKYLRNLSFVDSDRIGIWGWSYGGYMSALTLFLGGDYFKTAISVAPVTNWRFYDTIYTERYLQTPQQNPSGYDDFSPISHTEKLKKNFLLIHGTGDDNVHFQNTITLQEKLIQNEKQFESFFYPDKNHGISGGKTKIHLYTKMTEFILKNL
ncbi:MAG: DPP IV N-terminal domain-containing protein [Chitinophagaceae bacterium]|nr:DPP IV N-terminal domain-containing protein [Chitinophagaceae bacterium]